jgi:hypothetical protein
MEFESKLTPDQIKYRLTVLTLPLNGSTSYLQNQLLSKWNKDGTFYLLHTGDWYMVRSINPFVGIVTPHVVGATIRGKFILAKSDKVILCCFFGLAWMVMLSSCLLNKNFDFLRILLTIIALSIWTALVYMMFRYLPACFEKKNQKAVIEFIKKNLLE